MCNCFSEMQLILYQNGILFQKVCFSVLVFSLLLLFRICFEAMESLWPPLNKPIVKLAQKPMFLRVIKSYEHCKIILKSQALVGNVELYTLMMRNKKPRNKRNYFNLKDNHFYSKITFKQGKNFTK